MKKLIMSVSFIFLLSSAVYADGTAFTPLNFDDTSYSETSSTSFAPVSEHANTVVSDEAIGNGNIQNAILELENAQTDIRNDLINYRTKFADVDSQYRLIKAEREALKKQIRSVERRIKEIENAKERIKKNML